MWALRFAGVTEIGEEITVFLAGAVSFVVLEETIEELVSVTVEDGTRVKDSVE